MRKPEVVVESSISWIATRVVWWTTRVVGWVAAVDAVSLLYLVVFILRIDD